MKTLKVGIASYDAIKARTPPLPGVNSSPRPPTLAGELCQAAIQPQPRAAGGDRRNAETQPASLHELAAATGRTPGNLSRTPRTMERYGPVRLHRGARGMVRPEVAYRDVQLEMSLS